MQTFKFFKSDIIFDNNEESFLFRVIKTSLIWLLITKELRLLKLPRYLYVF